MRIKDTTSLAITAIGDIFVLYAALVLMLAIRYGEGLSQTVTAEHLAPFSLLFAVWLGVFLAAGLYDHAVFFSKKALFGSLIGAQAVNLAVAVLFFYTIPFFGIAPKTNLAIYLALATALVFLWRLYAAPFLAARKPMSAAIIGSEGYTAELYHALSDQNPYGIRAAMYIDPSAQSHAEISEMLLRAAETGRIAGVVVSLEEARRHNITPLLTTLFFRGLWVADAAVFYERVFDRIPLELVRHEWIITHFPHAAHFVYDGLKRAFDILLASVLLVAAAPLLAGAMLAMKILNGGPLFFVHERIGERGKPITLFKLQSWKQNRDGGWYTEGYGALRRGGAALRASRIDELPQLWNVIKGDLSLIGPRPDTVGIAERVRKEVPFYDTRYFIKPGLSGWAQIKQDIQPQSIPEMKTRLSYDLYYIKNRSFVLDLVIALRTIKTVLSRAGR